jgi:hypothetical protein
LLCDAELDLKSLSTSSFGKNAAVPSVLLAGHASQQQHRRLVVFTALGRLKKLSIKPKLDNRGSGGGIRSVSTTPCSRRDLAETTYH